MSPFAISTAILLAGTGWLTLRLLAHKAALRHVIKQYDKESTENWAIRQAVAQRLHETLDHLKRKEENHEVCDYIKDEMTKLKPMYDLAQGFIMERKEGIKREQ